MRGCDPPARCQGNDGIVHPRSGNALVSTCRLKLGGGHHRRRRCSLGGRTEICHQTCSGALADGGDTGSNCGPVLKDSGQGHQCAIGCYEADPDSGIRVQENFELSGHDKSFRSAGAFRAASLTPGRPDASCALHPRFWYKYPLNFSVCALHFVGFACGLTRPIALSLCKLRPTSAQNKGGPPCQVTRRRRALQAVSR